MASTSSTSSISQPKNFVSWLRGLFAAREAGILLALILMCVFLTTQSDVFLSSRNLLNVGRQISLLGIMAIGMTFILITREVDLSVGSIYAIGGLLTGMALVNEDMHLIPALAVGIGAGALIGLVNGVLSTYGKLPSFITTLGMMSVVRGVALLITDGQPVTVNARQGGIESVIEDFYYLGQGYLLDEIPMQLVFFLITIAVTWVILAFTTYGFRVYAVGGGEKAARVSGINVYSVKIWAFILMGALSAFAGILSLAFLPSSQAGRTGVGLELDVIAAAIVGGASLSGGEGTVLGAVLGVFIIGVLRNGLVLMQISPFWQTTIVGLVIIVAVAIDKWTEGRRTS